MKCSACGDQLTPSDKVCGACGEEVLSAPGPGTQPSQRHARASGVDEKTVLPIGPNAVLGGRYRLVQKVGEGGMGTVYVAHDQELDRRVAVKLLSAALVNDAEVNERFEREAKLTASLDHPNIVPMYDVGRHHGRPYLVMKLLEGDTLAGALRQKGGLTADETLHLVKQVASGLDYLHRRGFIHRDIKAGNIFVAADGQATILDFGILRARDATKGLTRTGMVMGTPHYMAPEQALGHRDVDHRVDLYALGVVLFECLTGTLPFEADSELKLIHLQAHAPPPDILDRAPWVPAPVASMMKRALAKQPEDRFSSGEELVLALEEAYQTGKGGTAPAHVEPVVPPQTAPSARRLKTVGDGPTSGEMRALRGSRARWVGPVLLAGVFVVAVAGFLVWRAPPEVAVFDAGVALVVPPLIEVPDAAVAELTPLDAGEVDAPEVADAGRLEMAVKRRGRLNVVTTRRGEPYWAQVSVDGLARGRTPLLLELPAGRHQLLIERAGFRSQERAVRVFPGRSVVVTLELVE